MCSAPFHPFLQTQEQSSNESHHNVATITSAIALPKPIATAVPNPTGTRSSVALVSA
jgi:hypothetical protein